MKIAEVEYLSRQVQLLRAVIQCFISERPCCLLILAAAEYCGGLTNLVWIDAISVVDSLPSVVLTGGFMTLFCRRS